MTSKTFKNMLLLGGASATNVAMTALQSLILGRLLNVEMFGVTRTATAYMILLTVLGHFTLHNALAASIVRATKKDEVAKYILHAILLVLGISIFVSATACLIISLTGFWPPPLRLPLVIVISSLPAVCLTILLNGCLEALGTYNTYMRVIFMAGFLPLLILIPLVWMWSLHGWLIGRILSAVLLLLVAILAIHEHLKWVPVSARYMWELLGFARIQIFSGLLSLTLLSADVILLEALTHDLRSVANYGAALLFYNACAIIPTSMGRVYFKQIAPSAPTPNKKQREFLLLICIAGLVSSLLLYTLGPFALGLFFNGNYENAKLVIKVMSLGLTFNFLWNCLSTVNIATSHPKSAVIISLAGSIAGLIALLILIPKYKATGAAMSMALAYTVGAIIGLGLLRKRVLSPGAVYAG